MLEIELKNIGRLEFGEKYFLAKTTVWDTLASGKSWNF